MAPTRAAATRARAPVVVALQLRRVLRAMIPILYLAPIDWSFLRQRPQQMALHLSHGGPLTYVDPVGLRWPRINDFSRLRSRFQAPRRTRAPLPVVHPRYLPFPGVTAVDAVNRRWLLRQMRAAFPIDAQPWMLWIGSPSPLAEALLAATNPNLVVYDCMDRYGAFHAGRARLRIDRAERFIAERADLVFATSARLAEHLRPVASKVMLAPNGVDYDLFARATPSAELGEPRHPVLGFHGTLGDWVDVELLELIARRRPDWSLVFIGPVCTLRARRLMSLSNVRRISTVDYEQLPAIASRFDIGLVPFVDNEITRCVHPIKALEYLAMGLPVASTRLADLAPLGDVVRFCDGADDWIAAIEAELCTAREPGRIAARRAAARACSWETVFRAVDDHLRAAISAKNIASPAIRQAA